MAKYKTIELVESIDNKPIFKRIFTTKFRTGKGVKKALGKIGRDLKTEFKNQVNSTSKTGRMYGTHQSSAPGETAANRTGNYRDKIGYSRNSKQLILGNSAEYAGFLENGTSRMRSFLGLKFRGGGYRMKPRPGLKNTIKGCCKPAIN